MEKIALSEIRKWFCEQRQRDWNDREEGRVWIQDVCEHFGIPWIRLENEEPSLTIPKEWLEDPSLLGGVDLTDGIEQSPDGDTFALVDAPPPTRVDYRGEECLVLQHSVNNNFRSDDFVLIAPSRFFDLES